MSLPILATLLASSPTAPAVPAPIPARPIELAARSLDGRPECVPFRWEESEGNPRAAITVPVVINGVSARFQLDTGADTNILYGDTADRLGWAAKGDRNFRPASFKVGPTQYDRPYVQLMRDMPAGKITGTLGLQSLVGRVSVIDYPGRRFCVFHEADLPRAIGANAKFVGGSLHEGKFLLPVGLVGQQKWDLVFDTGSSQMAVTVSPDVWQSFTARSSTTGAPLNVKGSAWGQPIEFAGNLTSKDLALGENVLLGRQPAYVQKGASSPPAPGASGTLGNAGLWDGIAVLILSGRTDFGWISGR